MRAEHDVTVAARPVAVVTRPQPQADEWVQRLQALGQPAQALPLMRIEPLAADAPDLQAAWAALASQSLVMFVSPNAVLRFFAAAPAGAHWPAATRAGATGPGTQAALLEQGVPAELVDAPRADAARFDAETLWTQVLQWRDWSGRAVLIVRGEDGRDWLADTLRQAGAHVSALAAYRRLPPAWSAGECAQLARLLPAALAPGAAPDAVWLFSSSQCVDHLMAQLDQGDPALRERALQRPALGTHPRIAQTARQAGFACVQAVSPDAAVIVDALRSLAARTAPVDTIHQLPSGLPAGGLRHRVFAVNDQTPSSSSLPDSPPAADTPSQVVTPAPAAAPAPAPIPASAPTPAPAAASLPPAAVAAPMAPVAVAPEASAGMLPGWVWAGGAALAVVAAASTWMSWDTHRQVRALEQELVKRQQGSTEQAAEARVLAKQAQDQARDSLAKVTVLEERLSEVTVQRSQLEELIQSLSRSRDENLVTDIDAAIRVAMQQSALTGSAEPVAAALRTAGERLARVNQPRLERLRRAVAQDLDRVRSVGVADLGGLLIKLDETVRLVDELPLVSARGTASAAEPASAVASAPARRAGAKVAAAASGPAQPTWLDEQWRAWKAPVVAIWDEVSALVRVTRIDHPETMLLAPEQGYFLRENLKLRLLNARLSLLSRQYDAAGADVQASQMSLLRYFDASSRKTQVALDLLRQVASQANQVSVPRPDETLAVIATLTAVR